MTRTGVAAAAAIWLASAWLRAQAPGPTAGAPPQPSSAAPAPTTAAADRVDFASQVQPILVEFCEDCHSTETRKGGLSVATYADLLEGGRSGAAVRPGASATSLLMDRLTGAIEPQMPKDEDALTAAQMSVIRTWIDEGARATREGPPAPQPWEAPLTLTRPVVPPATWPAWERPADRLVASYLRTTAKVDSPPELVSDAQFARRAHLDLWGLLPEPVALQAFLADRTADKRERLVKTLLADRERYAEHWMTFWNDLLRNEDGVSYFAEQNGRQSITPWMLEALRRNRPYDQMVTALLAPAKRDDPKGFLIGVNWRGETSAAVTPWMQASQNTAQVFLGVNMKCNACHDSFVSRWKLKDAYGLAAFFSPDSKLRLYRCDVARDEFTGPQFLFPGMRHMPRSDKLDDRREAAARLFTDRANGRMPRTIVNRLWERLLGRGIVASSDEMDTPPWSPELLDWLADDFVEHDYDLKHLLATIVTSRAYQLPSVPRKAEPSAKGYVFTGPEVRRLTAEQFADAIGAITGEWSTGPLPPRPAPSRPAPAPAANALRTDSDAVAGGVPGREWKAASNNLTRALGRPMRDQVTSVRPDDATTPQALELVNGEWLSDWLLRAGRRLTGQLPAEAYSRFTAGVSGRVPRARGFDLDVSRAESLWLVVEDAGSNAPERVRAAWRDAVLVDAHGTETTLASLTPAEAQGVTQAPVAGDVTSAIAAVHVLDPSVLRYDIAGRGFVRFRGAADVANPRSEIGATLSPALRFFIFDAPPNLERTRPPLKAVVLPSGPAPDGPRAMVDRIFWQALGRAPSDAERRLAESAIAGGSQANGMSADGVADLLWAVLMKPEFQLIF
ncbi:MAG TPA: DUF1549 domain-containing protein [Luteitalea sp.]|nr:DUF1549 domain-containing protein [Luteitalea sp.]